MDPGLDKPDAFLVPGPYIIFLIILAKGPHIHIEDGAIQLVMGVFLCDHGLFYGIHAAYRRAVTISAQVGIPGPDTLQPCDFFGFFPVQRPHEMAEIGPRRT